MVDPNVMRPIFPKGYVENPTTWLSWEDVVQLLTKARNYWLCTVRPNGYPHVIPKWGAWVADKLYFDGSPETRHAKNIINNPQIAAHLESGDEVVILEGHCKMLSKPGTQLGQKIAQAYRSKYAELGYSPKPTQWDFGGLFEITPHMALAWTSFTDDPTKFVFDIE